MTTKLTELLRRSYYLRNAEHIKAKKRTQHHGQAKIYVGVDMADPDARDKSVTMTVTTMGKKITARERIENMRIDKEFDDLDVLGECCGGEGIEIKEGQ